MIYDDDCSMDENLKVVECPLCDNEQFSENADRCRICGTKLYNYCLGQEIYDYHGNLEDTIYHKNPSNARFCETCGMQTEFFKQGLLKSWDKYRQEIDEMLGTDKENSSVPFTEDDLPF